ncbi:urinary protein 2-like [Peromyscus eremicus]|uniref:urinary protein 2-like n=1 Tax=Peromyscus californicus insignis TaxID=564181 RepID=UPI0022A71F0F|nr:urinary protein 2-like [Peromyscus californicus insignis]XP_059122734.1 urinary protein 2-like [Peromyscus eremicus]
MAKFMFLLLMLGAFSLVFFQVQATVCMVCKSFKRGHCLVGKSNCTTQYSPGCRTRNFYIFSQTGRWVHNHTELDCSEACYAENMYFGNLKISTFCCKGEDFCNRYHGQIVKKDIF